LKYKHDEKYLKEWFLDYAHVVRKEDVVELPPLTEILIKFPKQKIDVDVDDLSLYTVSTFITEFRKSVSKQKIEWVLEFLEDNPDTIVFSLFKVPAELIKRKLGDKVYLITGQYKKDFDNALQYQDKPIIATFALKEGANLQQYSLLQNSIDWKVYNIIAQKGSVYDYLRKTT